MQHPFGKHYLVEFIGCDPETIKYVSGFSTQFLDAARLSGATIISHAFHQFEPWGVSGIVFIAESHFSIHTWPEYGYAAFDVLTCGRMMPEKTIDALKGFFKAERVEVRVFERGF